MLQQRYLILGKIMEINCVLVTGGFDPLHNGHIAYFKAAKSLGNKLIVGINSDKWLIRKKGRAFMLFNERKLIIENLSMVDEVISFNDNDDTACDAIRKLIKKYNIITFANGGDRKNGNIPEEDEWGGHPRVSFVYGVGGEDKKNSSSWIMNLKLVSYIYRSHRTNLENELCYDAFLQMAESQDRLADNYSFNKLNLNKMYHYNILFDNNNPVLASGSQMLSDNVIRVMSRYYSFPDYRTDGTNLLEKVDNFYELQYVLKRLEDFKLIIWSRDKGSSFFKRLKVGRPDIFSNWKVYPKKIELKYKNNFQYVFYTGDISYLNEVIYDHG